MCAYFEKDELDSSGLETNSVDAWLWRREEPPVQIREQSAAYNPGEVEAVRPDFNEVTAG